MKKKLMNDPEVAATLWEVFGFTSSARSDEVVHATDQLLKEERSPLHALYRLQDDLEPNELVAVAFAVGELVGESRQERLKLIRTPNPDADTWEVFDFPSEARAEAVMGMLNQMLSSGLGIFDCLYKIQNLIPANELLAVAFVLGATVDSAKIVQQAKEEKPHDH